MKNYTITVNGNVYDVTVEETGSTPSTASTPRRAEILVVQHLLPLHQRLLHLQEQEASRLRPELPERYLSSRLRLAMQ